MMKNKFKWIIIQLIVILAFGACSEDFFNESPGDRITPEEHYRSKVDADLACRTASAILMEDAARLTFVNDLLSDITEITENAGLNWQEINNHEISVDNPYADPSALYKIIINANESLFHIDSIMSRDQDMTDIELRVYKGNLIGIRSWAYFMIVRLYGEAAYIKDNLPELPDEDLVYIGREAMLDTLINHLLPYLDIDYVDIGNLIMYNKALIGEIYLEKQDYNNAVTYLRMAIEGFENDNRTYKISGTFKKGNWWEIFYNSAQNGSEVMIAVPFSIYNGRPNMIEKWYYYNYDYIAKPTSIITNLFEKQNDNEGDENRGNMVSYYSQDDICFVLKYSWDIDELSSDIIIYRAADIHLLLAEALNRSGSSDIALAILNEGYNEYTGWEYNMGIRGRVYLDERSVPDGVDRVKYIEDLIIEERAMELAFEGKRWFDLMRVARRRGNAYLANRVAAKFSDQAMANKIKEQLNSEENWYLPFEK